MFLVLITLLLYLGSTKAETEHVTVLTKKGNIIGFKNDEYTTFFGIPYAQVNENNPFGSNLPHPYFRKPFIANDSSITCPQVGPNTGGILQCLTLDIYVPKMASLHHKAAILVWFYGGGFVSGSARNYGGQHLVKQDIIVITVNYRLGPYGFLCLNDESVPGNQGLKDQITALRWIKKNIKGFNGDPNKVTIAGETYGGGAVDLHLYSRYETLFDKAIIQSGSLYMPGYFGNRDYDAPIKICIHLGRKVTSNREALKHLARQNPISVMAAARELSMRLTPCKEIRFRGIQQFVTKCINHLSNPDRIESVKIMIGFNSKEDFGKYVNQKKEFYHKLGDIFYRNLKNNFILRNCELDKLSDIVKTFYLGSKHIGVDSVSELSDYSSDFNLNYAVEKSVSKYMEQGGTAYKYMFSYIGGCIYQNMTGAGATNGEELKYLFETSAELSSDEQRMMRERMTTLWANFVKFGNPTPQTTTLLPVIWEPVTGNSRPYLDINVNMTMKDHAFKERMAFWDLFMQKYDRTEQKS